VAGPTVLKRYWLGYQRTLLRAALGGLLTVLTGLLDATLTRLLLLQTVLARLLGAALTWLLLRTTLAHLLGAALT